MSAQSPWLLSRWFVVSSKTIPVCATWITARHLFLVSITHCIIFQNSVVDTVTLPTDERDYIDALVVSISAPQEFYIQRHSEKFSSALQGLTDEMNEHFAQSSIREYCYIIITSSYIIAVPKKVHMDTVYGVCWEDGSWCRAVVLSIADSKVVVQFPDYGNKEIISADKLRVIPSSFLKLPFQAVCCSLHNVSATSEDAVQIFEDIAFEQCCLLEVIEK